MVPEIAHNLVKCGRWSGSKIILRDK